MKKLLFSIVAIGALGLFSCKKCQTCTTSVSQTVMGTQVSTNTSEEYCGDDYDNAPPESSVNQSVAGVQQTVTITCVDK